MGSGSLGKARVLVFQSMTGLMSCSQVIPKINSYLIETKIRSCTEIKPFSYVNKASDTGFGALNDFFGH